MDEDITTKKFSFKLVLFIGILCLLIIFIGLIGLQVGYTKGVDAADKWYQETYLPKKCVCKEFNYYREEYQPILDMPIFNST